MDKGALSFKFSDFADSLTPIEGRVTEIGSCVIGEACGDSCLT